MSAQRVARLIRLAESPDITQHALTPGRLVELTEREGEVRKERRKMELTAATSVPSIPWDGMQLRKCIAWDV